MVIKTAKTKIVGTGSYCNNTNHMSWSSTLKENCYQHGLKWSGLLAFILLLLLLGECQPKHKTKWATLNMQKNKHKLEDLYSCTLKLDDKQNWLQIQAHHKEWLRKIKTQFCGPHILAYVDLIGYTYSFEPSENKLSFTYVLHWSFCQQVIKSLQMFHLL